ncbi:MAG: nitroreductase family protein [Calditrichia bacterium]
MKAPKLIPLSGYEKAAPEELLQRSREFFEKMRHRRSIRQFSGEAVPREVIENCIRTAATAPSGANLQPWHFVAVSSTSLKREIRLAAEKEEYEFYHHRATAEWLEALAPLGTDEHKEFLETAPWLIVIFVQRYGIRPDGSHRKHYYALESVGIATGMLITALHRCGLATLTHTPSPMGFLNKILKRPANEKPFLNLVAGYPAEDATVPEIRKKEFREIATFLE